MSPVQPLAQIWSMRCDQNLTSDERISTQEKLSNFLKMVRTGESGTSRKLEYFCWPTTHKVKIVCKSQLLPVLTDEASKMRRKSEAKLDAASSSGG